MNKIRLFLQSYYDELRFKVTWPRMSELQVNTVTVLVASFIIAILIALMDLVFSSGLNALYGLFK